MTNDVSATIDIGRVGLWTGALDQLPSSESVEWVAEAEALGYGAMWIPETVGRDPFITASILLGGTTNIAVATGIANIYARDPMTMANTQRSLEEAFPGRFLLGLGVSHHTLVEWVRKHDYSKPLSYMREYLAAMDKAMFKAHGPAIRPDTVLAALGPKMLELAAGSTAGAHPYFVPVEHTALARETMGPDARLYPEQMVVLETDPAKAREIARTHMAVYLGLPNYANNLIRLGFTAEELADGGSDKVVDAIVAWGDEAAIAERIQAQFDAGADHVCVQTLTKSADDIRPAWRALAPALLS
ncbi:MAG: putative F420-dependent oxidoreductase [Candidatus Poriferisodalaceae bacterium]|jgi:probable F420-dependent oxidoreductase